MATGLAVIFLVVIFSGVGMRIFDVADLGGRPRFFGAVWSVGVDGISEGDFVSDVWEMLCGGGLTIES